MNDPEPRTRSVLHRIGGRAIAMWALVAVSALAAAASPARPTGLRLADAVWCGLLGAAVPLVASRSRRLPLVWAGGIAAVMGIGGDVTTVIATVALLALIGVVTFSERRDRVVATALGALTVQVLLRSPSFGFVGLPAIVGAVALAPVVWSGYSMARQRERRAGAMAVLITAAVVLVLGSAAMVTALGTRSTLEDGVDLAARGLESIGAGDTPGAADRFTAAADTFQDGSDSLEGWLTWGGRFVPVVGQHVEALRRVASAGVVLDRSAATTASTANYRELTADDGQVDLAAIAALQQPVADSAATITAALDSVDTVRSPWLVRSVAGQLDSFGERLADAGDQADIAAEGLAVAPELLGANGPRHYFVAFATPGESRNGGGFVGAFGILTADAGHLELTETGSLNALDAQGAPYAFDPPPDWNERYESYSVDTFLGNLAASPDWPTDRGVIGQLYPQTPGGTRIDGALYLDPAAIAALLQLTGPVEVPELETTLDSGNAERFLLQDQYVLVGGNNPQRKELLGDAARATFDALTSRPLPGIATLTGVLGGLVDAGHLRMSVDDPVSEAFLDRVGLAGQWDIPPGTDYVSVRWANLLSNKIDSFIHRNIEVSSTVDPETATVTQKVTVTVRNDAPPSGLPPYVIGNQLGLPVGTSQDILALYSPHQLDTVSIDGEPIGSATESEFGGPVYSLVVEVPSGKSRTVVFELHGAVPAWPYALQVVPQAMAHPDQTTVRVAGVPGLEPAPQFRGPLVDTVNVNTR